MQKDPSNERTCLRTHGRAYKGHSSDSLSPSSFWCTIHRCFCCYESHNSYARKQLDTRTCRGVLRPTRDNISAEVLTFLCGFSHCAGLAIPSLVSPTRAQRSTTPAIRACSKHPIEEARFLRAHPNHWILLKPRFDHGSCHKSVACFVSVVRGFLGFCSTFSFASLYSFFHHACFFRFFVFMHFELFPVLFSILFRTSILCGRWTVLGTSLQHQIRWHKIDAGSLISKNRKVLVLGAQKFEGTATNPFVLIQFGVHHEKTCPHVLFNVFFSLHVSPMNGRGWLFVLRVGKMNWIVTLKFMHRGYINVWLFWISGSMLGCGSLGNALAALCYRSNFLRLYTPRTILCIPLKRAKSLHLAPLSDYEQSWLAMGSMCRHKKWRVTFTSWGISTIVWTAGAPLWDSVDLHWFPCSLVRICVVCATIQSAQHGRRPCAFSHHSRISASACLCNFLCKVVVLIHAAIMKASPSFLSDLYFLCCHVYCIIMRHRYRTLVHAWRVMWMWCVAFLCWFYHWARVEGELCNALSHELFVNEWISIIYELTLNCFAWPYVYVFVSCIV